MANSQIVRQHVHVVEPSNQEDVGSLWRRFLYTKGVGSKYDHTKHFHASEVSQFLEHTELAQKMPYGRTLARSSDMQRSILDEVLIDGRKWRTAMSYVGSTSLRTIITPEILGYQETVNLLGIEVLINKPHEVKAFGKRFKRITAPHHIGWWSGHIQSVDNNFQGGDTLVRFILDEYPGKVFTHVIRTARGRWRNTTTDGWGWIGKKFAETILEHRVDVGSGFQFTLLEPKPANHGKGHMGVRSDIGYDIITYESKGEIAHTGNLFSFGLLNQLHQGELFTNIQPTVNINLFEARGGRYYQDLGQQFFTGLFDMIDDDMAFTQDMNKLLRTDDDGDYIIPDGFLLAKAWANGIDPRNHASLLEKWFRAKADSKQQVRIDGFRLPVGDKGFGMYLSPEWAIFDYEGIPHEEKSELHDGEMYAKGLKGKALVVRSPMETPNSYAVPTLVFLSSAAEFDSGVFTQIAADYMVTIDRPLQNPDMDDWLQINTDPDVVDWAMQWKSDYPNIYMDEQPVVQPKANRFDSRIKPIVYSRNLILRTVLEMARIRTSIGELVDLAMLDVAQTQLREDGVKGLLLKDLPRIAKAAEEYPRYLCAEVGNNNGFVIDALNKTGQMIAGFGKHLWGPVDKGEEDKSLYGSLPWVPRFWQYSGKRPGGDRSSPRLRERNVPVIQTRLDDVHDELVVIKNEAFQHIRKETWSRAFIPDTEFVQYPAHPQALRVAKDVRSRYIVRMKELSKKFKDEGKDLEGSPVSENEAPFKAFSVAQREIAEYVKNHPLALDVWVKMIDLIYSSKAATSAKLEEDGSVSAFGDGLLWGKDTGDLTIDAMRRLGLSSEWMAIAWMDKRKRHDYINVTSGVIVDHTMVRIFGAEDIADNYIGTVDAPDGEYIMVAGRIKVPVPQDLDGAGANVLTFVVTNVWKERLAYKMAVQADVDKWIGLIGTRAYAKPGIYRTRSKPDGITMLQVFIEGTDKPIGWADKAIPSVTEEIHGSLNSNTPYTMLFIADKQ